MIATFEQITPKALARLDRDELEELCLSLEQADLPRILRKHAAARAEGIPPEIRHANGGLDLRKAMELGRNYDGSPASYVEILKAGRERLHAMTPKEREAYDAQDNADLEELLQWREGRGRHVDFSGMRLVLLEANLRLARFNRERYAEPVSAKTEPKAKPKADPLPAANPIPEPATIIAEEGRPADQPRPRMRTIDKPGYRAAVVWYMRRDGSFFPTVNDRPITEEQAAEYPREMQTRAYEYREYSDDVAWGRA